MPSLPTNQENHFYRVHGRLQDDDRNLTREDLELAVNVAYVMDEKSQKRIQELESLIQQLLDTEGVISTSHNRQVVKGILHK